VTAALITLTVLSAIGELVGTATVAVNYAKGHRIARDIAESSLADGRAPAAVSLRYDDPVQANWAADEAKGQVRSLAGQLTARWYLTAGLVAYGIGALAGCGAGLLAITR
jgi:hypothetical protein